ncbi:hypothetical protein CDA63_14145 [Hymenobacter amundsenii]|uniref:PKD domain-containing protein n=1 Tax=Hymenobacter amundsenii TaxID=2006685 RepID=A0A246FIQ9_9BACT|nr:PKD domain-containing protein [Hymenobacter amundsenii]OWP62426.1 hypothetical protein CDA63_14145 [Hymenobacter amundsenii]
MNTNRLLLAATVLLLSACESEPEVPTPVALVKAAFRLPAELEQAAAITFQNESQNATSYTWDFGDTTPADEAENPTHRYGQAGKYTVRLVAHGTASNDTIRKTIIIDNYKLSRLPVKFSGIYSSTKVGVFKHGLEPNAVYYSYPDTLVILTTSGNKIVWGKDTLAYAPGSLLFPDLPANNAFKFRKFHQKGLFYFTGLEQIIYFHSKGDSISAERNSILSHSTNSVRYKGVRLP